MFSRFKTRRKSMGATVTTASTGGTTEEQPYSTKRSFLDFFRRARRKKIKGDSENTNGAGKSQATSQDHKTSAIHEKQTVGSAQENSVQPPDHLTVNDVQQLFSGAPHFSTSLAEGQIQVSVAHPWDFELQTRDASDSTSIPHAAFNGATLHQHLPKQETSDTTTPRQMTYNIGVVESPSMVASTGREPGTVGLEFFLQEAESDIINVHIDEEDPGEIFENFSNFELLESQPEKLGIRKFELATVAERLVELSTIYEARSGNEGSFSILNYTSSGGLYAELFGKILMPPKYDSSTTDPTGLKVQIETLLRLLNLKRVWYNFSTVEWRIRVGQLLYTDGGHDIADSNISEPEDGLSERDVVLLQLLLACELYMRLEAVAALSKQEVQTDLKLTVDDMQSFRRMESRKTKWDLVFARRFLENMVAKTYTRPKLVPQTDKTLARGWFGVSQRESTIKIDEVDIAFEPRRQELQLNGLFYFAKALEWPDGEALKTHFNQVLASNGIEQVPASPSIYATPLSTPGTLTPRSFRSNRESSYFAGANSPEMTPRSFQLQPPSRLDLLDSDDSPHDSKPSIGGWLTRSYLTGLIMPGEPICHLLISSILENDAESIVALGENATLYGGFVYKGRSFWSKSCVAGRVLACLESTKECMGWISSAVLPDGYGDGWLDVYSAPTQLAKIDLDDDALAKRTHLLAGRDASEVSFAELSLPQDRTSETRGTAIRFESLRLRHNSAAHALSEEPTLSASLGFTVPNEDELHDIPLANLVQFISAFPCTPPKDVTAMKHVTASNGTVETKVAVVPSHPLHVAYHYRWLHSTQLLDPKLDVDEGESDMVVVVDARGDAVLELLARAWCSSEGVNALIARVGTTCLSCAIREAKGLGVKIVVRVGDS